jgi:hypothetical protein
MATKIKEGLEFLHKIITPYGYDVVLLGDRGFRNVHLFKFINETLKWKYCIRCTREETFKYLGKNFRLKVIEDEQECVKLYRSYIEIHIKDKDNYYEN